MPPEHEPTGEEFLAEKYGDLPGSHEVDRASSKAKSEGQKISSREERVGAYMERLERITESEDKQGKRRGLELLSQKILREFTISTEDEETLNALARGLYKSEKKLAIEQGRGADIEKLESQEDVIERYKPLIIEKAEQQRKTLQSWLDYLSENDAKQPMWFRYFVVRNLSKMGTLDKDKMTYSKRTPKTIAPFPELNSEALGWVYKRLSGQDTSYEEEIIDPNDPEAEEKQKRADEKRAYFEKILKAKDFSSLYAFAQIETAGKLNRESVEGEWRKYDRGGDWQKLEGDLRGKGTGWCTAEGSAQDHLEGGDFYVYYTKGTEGQYTEPRVAIRMEGEQVGEVRGVNQRQELEPELVDTAQEQYHSLPGGEKYDKKAADMREMTIIYKKHQAGEQLTKDELIFLYEINSPIEGFGYEKDPRVVELRHQRDPKEDAPIVLDCGPQEIAWSQQEINDQTKAYIGPLFKGVFQMPNLENIFTSFPERIVRKGELEIGGIGKEQLKQELKNRGVNISNVAEYMIDSPDFTTRENREQITTVRLSVGDLGFTGSATTEQVYQRAQEFGLDICPAEVGPYQRLKDINQPMGDWYWVAMKQIASQDGSPCVFNLHRHVRGLWLGGGWAEPSGEWGPSSKFLFRLRKESLET